MKIINDLCTKVCKWIDYSDCSKVCSISNSQNRTIRKTWEGDLDLWVEKSSNEYDEHIEQGQYLCFRTFLYTGQKPISSECKVRQHTTVPVKELPSTSKFYENRISLKND